MRYDKEFSLSDIFTNDKYKARAILCVFVVIIAVLIVLARTAPEPEKKESTNNTSNNNTNTNTNNLPEINDNSSDSNSLYNRFSFIRLNNYEFNFTIDTNKKIIVDGQRFDNKFKMLVKSDNESYEYQMRNKITKAKINGVLTSVNTPTVLIDYFDNNVLYTLLYYSQKTEETTEKIEYTISNSYLSKLLSQQINISIPDDKKEINNKITVYLNNNKINHIYMDLNNFVENIQEIEKLTIDLKYDKVGQINDFKLDF